MLYHPRSPLPPEWNPTVPLRVAHPIGPTTEWKLSRTAADREQCLAALSEAAEVTPMPALVVSDDCGIENRVLVSRLGNARIDPIETTCAVALRMAMWERHSLRPAAQQVFGQDIAVIRQIGSYNCRRMRTSAGVGRQMSTHSRAEAIDITGFDLPDGRRIRLLEHWNGQADEAAFLRAARDGACDVFRTTLSPDFNALHADHFHLQSRGWGTCR
ncbi:extensin family protein [Loktanella sp. IMCC34160]|uniref:extensin-like domain-containing protein n=1 Tax=Loktanella sp. IMCC34160 TaxID=2510646 RepID=UPI001F5DC5F5|nr:extensin family protein [Loktanella sp. IMCC34160]